jgi:TPR repeat protein
LSLLLVAGLLSLAAYLGTSDTNPSLVTSKPEILPKKVNLSAVIQKCNGGDSDQCLALGYIHLRGVVGDRDFLMAKKYFEKACDGYVDLNRKELQCEAIGRIFDDGKEARVDKKIANVFHEKAKAAHLQAVSPITIEKSSETCQEGERASCFHSALKALKQIHPDLQKAQSLLFKACDDKAGVIVPGEEYPGKFCGLAAEFFEYGKDGLSVDLNRAGELYFKACHIAENSPLKNGFMCDLTGVFFRDKKDDRKVAASSFRRACAMKSPGACEHLQRLSLSQEL